MINVNDIKNGMTVKIDNNIYTVVEFQHVKPGKGSAFVRTKLKNIRTGATTEITFNAGVKIETARVEKQNMQFLYSQGDTYFPSAVDTRILSPSLINIGTFITIPVSSSASFIAVDVVFPLTPGSDLVIRYSILSGKITPTTSPS